MCYSRPRRFLQTCGSITSMPRVTKVIAVHELSLIDQRGGEERGERRVIL